MGKFQDQSDSDRALVERANIVWHDLEAESYDYRHPEIMDEVAGVWSDLVDLIAARLSGQRPRVMDVGVGTGFVPSVLSRRLNPLSVLCLDISHRMLLTSRQKLSSPSDNTQYFFVQANVEKMPIKPTLSSCMRMFDLITLNSVLHHLYDPTAFLSQLAVLLKPGALLIVAHEPNRRFFLNIYLSKYAIASRLGGRLRRFIHWCSGRATFSASAENREVESLDLNDLELPVGTHRNIQAYVDYHSPMSGSFLPDADKGFCIDNLTQHLEKLGCRLLAFRTYAHMGKFSHVSGFPFRESLERVHASIFPQDGLLFYTVFEKQA